MIDQKTLAAENGTPAPDVVENFDPESGEVTYTVKFASSAASVRVEEVRVQMTETAMLVKCGIDGEEYWSDEECPRAHKHELILRNAWRAVLPGRRRDHNQR